MIRLRAAAIAVLTLFVSGVAVTRAQYSGGPPNDALLGSLIDEALERNPDVLAAREAVAAARSRPAQGRSLPNPMVSLSYTNDGVSPSLGTEEMTTLALMWSQDLPFPGKRELRGEVLDRAADQVEQQAARVKLGVTAAVKRSYYGLILTRDLLALIGEQEEVWKQIEGVARARYSVGQGTQQDVLRAQIEVTRIEQFRAEQVAEAAVRLAELNRLLDRPATAPLDTTRRLDLVSLEDDLDTTLERLAGISPELASARAAVEQARLAVELARKEFKPDFTVQGGYMNRGALDPMWQAGFGLSLPIFRERLRAGVAEAEAALRGGERSVESVALQLRLRTQERLAQLAATAKIAGLYGGGIIPQDRMSVEAALASYQTGKLPFVAVLEALTTLYSDRATHLELLANHEKLRASLDEASLEATSAMASAGAAGMAAVAGGSLGTAGSGAGASSSGAMGKQ